MNIKELIKICSQYPEVKVQEDKGILNLYLKSKTGYSELQFVSISDAILLSYININLPSWEGWILDTEKDILLFNYCVDGRCEIELKNGDFTFLSGGDVSLSMVSAKDNFKFPGSRYNGIELFVDLNPLENGAVELFGKEIINIKDIFLRYCQNKDLYVACVNERVEFILQQLWKLKGASNPRISLKVLEVLLEMKESPLDSYNPPRMYYSKIHVEIAKKAEEIIMKDLSNHYPAKYFADYFGISESTFKNYFKGVFGKSYSIYQKCKRMEMAAELLESTKSKLSEIAGKVGYENHSKFSSAFKAYYKISPSDYRRKKHLEKIE